MSRRISRVAIVFSVALLAGLLVWPAAAGAASTTFSGRATVLQGTVLGVQIPCLTPGPADCKGLVDTGPVAAGGGELESNLVCYPQGVNCVISSPVGDPTGGTLAAQVLHAAVVAQGNKSRAEASVAKFRLSNVAGNTISAEFLRAQAEAKCTNGRASVSGSSDIAELTINGQTVAVTGEANQRIDLDPLTGSYVLVNEQVASASGDRGDITVNALHIVIPLANTDVIVAQAHADIRCGGSQSCAGAEKVTGGGYVLNGGVKRNFAVAGRQLEPWGHFLFVDHATGDKMKATRVDPITFDAAGFAVITGLAEVNGAGSYPFTAKVKDNGEPGKGRDQFELISGYPPLNQPLTVLSGGNIQFHKPCK